jgi:large subunit ribosomal protein L24
MKKLKIKTGATVKVIAGSDKGAQGTVLAIDPDKMKIRVQGVRMQTHYEQDGLKQIEGFIDYSNVKLVKQAAAKKKTAKKAAKNA